MKNHIINRIAVQKIQKTDSLSQFLSEPLINLNIFITAENPLNFRKKRGPKYSMGIGEQPTAAPGGHRGADQKNMTPVIVGACRLRQFLNQFRAVGQTVKSFDLKHKGNLLLPLHNPQNPPEQRTAVAARHRGPRIFRGFLSAQQPGLKFLPGCLLLIPLVNAPRDSVRENNRETSGLAGKK